MDTYTMIAQSTFDIKLSPSARAVYNVLRSFSDSKYKDVEASYERIAERANVSRRTAMRAAEELKQVGLIFIKKINGRWNQYMFRKFDHTKKAEGDDNSTSGSDKSTPRSDKSTPEPSKIVTGRDDESNMGGGDKSAPILDSVNHTLEPDESTKQLLVSLTNYLRAAMSPMQDKPIDIQKLLAHIRTTYPNLHPAHLPAFFHWYLHNVVGKDGKPYRLPTKIDSIAQHFSKFWKSADRKNTDHEVTINPNQDYSHSAFLLTNQSQSKLTDEDYMNQLKAQYPDLFSD